MKIIQIVPRASPQVIRNRLSRSGFLSTYVRGPCVFNSSSKASVNDSLTCNTDVLPSTIDFIPNYQEVSVLYKKKKLAFYSRITNYCNLFYVVGNLIIVLLAAQLVAQLSNEERQEMVNNSLAVPINQKPTHYSINRLIVVGINKKIKHLNKRINNLNKSLQETLKWRATVEMDLKEIKKSNFKHNELIARKVKQGLNLYDADKIGMIDYALESGGGCVMSIPDTTPLPAQFSYDLMGFVTMHNPSSPRLLIQPGTLPGNCFAFVGTTGRIRIRLASSVKITAVTMEHAYASLVGDMSSAPKDFKVYGLLKRDSETGDELGAFTYKLNETALQTFGLEYWKSYQHVELRILTNHGNLDYTCIYRFRVHGNGL